MVDAGNRIHVEAQTVEAPTLEQSVGVINLCSKVGSNTRIQIPHCSLAILYDGNCVCAKYTVIFGCGSMPYYSAVLLSYTKVIASSHVQIMRDTWYGGYLLTYNSKGKQHNHLQQQLLHNSETPRAHA